MRNSTERVILIGYRGTGKSCVARRLAKGWGWKAIDADELLEARLGMSIREVFQVRGEAAFRSHESALLQELLGREKECVLATGGGVVLAACNRDLLRRSGFVVWLKAGPEAIKARLDQDGTTASRRPALTGLEGLAEIRELLRRREPLYKECADLEVETEGLTPDEVAAEIAGRIPIPIKAAGSEPGERES